MSTVFPKEERRGFVGLSVAQFYILCAFVTLWEVVARYVFDAPTSWAFEVVMVLCATAWMLSVGYVTSHKRHIGITVFYLMAGQDTRWWLDLFGMVVGVFAHYMLATDTLVRALESIDIGTVSIVIALIALMATGMPLGVVTLLISNASCCDPWTWTGSAH